MLTQHRRDGSTFNAEVATLDAPTPPEESTMVIVKPTDVAAAPEAPSPESRRSKIPLGGARALGDLPGSMASDESVAQELGTDGSQFVAIDARTLGEEACARVRELADSRNVDVVLYCTRGLVRVQRRGFSRALYALLLNAVKANPKGFPVILSVGETDDGDTIWRIQDESDGGSNDALADLDRSDLGLALASSLIEEHGGLLRFETARGVGTTTTIWLPQHP